MTPALQVVPPPSTPQLSPPAARTLLAILVNAREPSAEREVAKAA